MAEVYFKIRADIEVAEKLAAKMKDLKTQLAGMTGEVDKRAFGKLVKELNATSKEFDTVAKRVAANEAKMMQYTRTTSGTLSSLAKLTQLKMQETGSYIDGLSSKILAQKNVVRNAETDYKRLSSAYKVANGTDKPGLGADMNNAKALLDNEKNSLRNLTAERDRARLSLKSLKDENSNYTKELAKGRDVIDRVKGSMKSLLVQMGGVYALKNFAEKIIEVRGQMQMLEVSLSSLLKSKSEADKLMAQLVQSALTTPFQITDLATGAKQLIAYGFAARDVNSTLLTLGNVASGLNLPLERLTYLYGTTMTQGRLYARDLMQFTTSGIPLLGELASMMNVTTTKINEMVSNGEIGFPEVEKAFARMTGEGGKFYNLMQEQSKTIPGQISNLKDSITIMFNEMGKSQEGVIQGGISSVKYLVDNYEQVGRVLTALIATYGFYKTALMATVALQGAAGLVENIRLTAMFRKELGLLTAAQQAFNVTSKSNPYILFATILVGLGTAIWAFTKGTDEATEATIGLAKANKEASEEFGKESAKIKVLQDIVNNSNIAYEHRRTALNELKKIIPGYNGMISEEGKLTNNNTSAIKDYLVQLERQIKMKAAQEELEAAYRNKRKLEGERVVANEKYQKVAGNSASYDRPLIDIAGMFGQTDLQQAKKGLDDVDTKLGAVNRTIADLNTEIATTSQATTSADTPVRTFSEQFKDASDNVKRLETDLKNLRAGKGDVTDFVKAISDTEDALEEAKKTYDLLKGTNVKAENDLKKAQKELAEQTKNDTAKEIELRKELSDNIAKANIDAMEEGFDKEMAELKFEHEQKKEAIRDFAKKLLNAENEVAKNTWIAKGGTAETFEPASSVSLKGQLRIGALNNYEDKAYLEGRKKLYKSVLDEYQTFDERRKAIDENYQREFNKLVMLNNGKNTEVILGKIEVLKEETKKAKQAVTDEELDKTRATSSLLIQIFSDTSTMSRKRLKETLDATKQLVAYLKGLSTVLPEGITKEAAAGIKGTAKEIEAIMDKLNETQAAYDNETDYPFAGFVKGIALIRQSAKTAADALVETDVKKKKLLESQADSEMDRGVKMLESGAVEATKMVSYLADKMVELAKVTGDTKLKEFAEQFKAVSDLMSATAQGAQSGGWIGAVVAAATSMITQTIDAFMVAQAEMAEFKQNQIDFLNAYRQLLLKIKSENYETVFGVKALGRAADAAVNAREALKDYQNFLEERTLPLLERERKATGVATFFGFGGGMNSMITKESITLMSAYKKGYTDLQGMAIKTKDQSGWANFWGKKDEYTSLKDLAPQLWDKDGEFNVEAAKAFLETNTQISDAQKKQIQNIIDLKDAYEANMQIIREDIKDTFGELGPALTDSIVQSIMTGADAFGVFEEAGNSAIEKLGEKLMYELFFAEKFKKLQTDLEASYDLGTPQAVADAQLKLVDDFYSNLNTDMENAQKWGEQWKVKAKDSGFDIWNGSDSQQEKGGGFQSMSQDSADELSGRFTAMQMSTISLEQRSRENLIALTEIHSSINSAGFEEYHRQSLEMVDEMRAQSVQAVKHLAKIEKNTDVLPEMGQTLKNIDKNTQNL